MRIDHDWLAGWNKLDSVIFIHSWYLYSTPSRNLLTGNISFLPFLYFYFASNFRTFHL